MVSFFRSRRRNTASTTEAALDARMGRFQEKHIISALLGAATISVLCCSLVEPVWFKIHSDVCCYNYLGIAPFMHTLPYDGFLPEPNVKGCEDRLLNDVETYNLCMSDKTIMTIQILASVVILTIITSLFAFTLDVLAPRKYPFWKVVKRHAFGHVVTVILCAVSLGFSYWSSQEIHNHMYMLIARNPQSHLTNLRVEFGMGVYMTTAAGCLAVLAVASNLMRQYPTAWEEQAEELALVSDDDDFAVATGDHLDSTLDPPPYSP